MCLFTMEQGDWTDWYRRAVRIMLGTSTCSVSCKGLIVPCGRVPDLQSGGRRFESQPGLLRTKVYSAFHPSGVGQWVPAAAGKAKAGMAHSDCGWTCGRAGKTVKSLENTCHTWALLLWWFTTKRRYIKLSSVCTFLPLLAICLAPTTTRRGPTKAVIYMPKGPRVSLLLETLCRAEGGFSKTGRSRAVRPDVYQRYDERRAGDTVQHHQQTRIQLHQRLHQRLQSVYVCCHNIVLYYHYASVPVGPRH